MRLEAETISVFDAFEAIEVFFEKRWTDGLPVVPPTAGAVARMIALSGRDPGEVIGVVPPKNHLATIEALAINSVMAGCKPEYFPVVIAAAEAMLEPSHNLAGVQTTTHCCVPLLIVNGPVVKDIGVNGGIGVFGSGFRANGTIGRAIRLILWNLGGNYPGEPDMSTMAHPGKWSYCIAENEDENPWEPLHVERGLPWGVSALTVFSCEAPHSALCNGTAEQTLMTICSTMSTIGNNNVYSYGQILVVLSPTIVPDLLAAGFTTKRAVQQYLWENSQVRLGLLRRYGGHTPAALARWWPEDLDLENDEQMMPLTRTPEDILTVVAGPKEGGFFCMVCPGWGDHGGLAVTKQVQWPPSERS